MSRNWTREQAEAYMRRSMKEQPRARQKIQAEAMISWPAEENRPSIRARSPQALAVNDATKVQAGCVPKAHGARYNVEIVLAWFKEMGLPEPVPEFRFHAERLWRFDFCFVDSKLAVEVNGGIFSGGAHVRGAALLREFEKLNAAAVAGFRVIFVTPDQLCLTETAETIRAALNA